MAKVHRGELQPMRAPKHIAGDLVTPKQLKYAKAIARKLGLQLPKGHTSECFSRFIKAHKEAYLASW